MKRPLQFRPLCWTFRQDMIPEPEWKAATSCQTSACSAGVLLCFTFLTGSRRDTRSILHPRRTVSHPFPASTGTWTFNPKDLGIWRVADSLSFTLISGICTMPWRYKLHLLNWHKIGQQLWWYLTGFSLTTISLHWVVNNKVISLAGETNFSPHFE